jgi:hypothetical protein
VQSQFRLTSDILPPQLCRFVPCQSSARTIEVTGEQRETSGDDLLPAIAIRPNSLDFTSAIHSFIVISPDHLIEPPGTPPPAIFC